MKSAGVQSCKAEYYVKNDAFQKISAYNAYGEHHNNIYYRRNGKFKTVLVYFSLFFGENFLANKKVNYNTAKLSYNPDHPLSFAFAYSVFLVFCVNGRFTE